MNAKRTFVLFTPKNFPQKSERFRYMTPLYQAQSWKVIRTNKPHKKTRKNVLIPLISLHIKKILQFAEEPCRLTLHTSLAYFHWLQFRCSSLRTSNWPNDPYTTSLTKHSRFVSPEYYPRMALQCCRLASLASSLGWLVGNKYSLFEIGSYFTFLSKLNLMI